MSGAVVSDPHLIHAVSGRARLHLPGWSGEGHQRLERCLRGAPGVRSVAANALTGNVLVRFDPTLTDSAALLRAAAASVAGALAAAPPEQALAAPQRPPAAPRALHEGRGGAKRARIVVRGLDRDPDLSRRVVERLEQRPGVRARANPLTGRVLVEFSMHQVDIGDLLADVADMELPTLLGEDNPAHPLDPAPLVQSAARTLGASLGLALLAIRQGTGQSGPPLGGMAPAQAAAVIGLLQGFPATRNGLRAMLGRNIADVVFSAAGIVTLALSGSPLGLAVSGAEALRLLTEVRARRAAWRAYERRLGDVAAAQPGALIRLDAGERTPLAAQVVEGTGTATGKDGLPVAARPGAALPAGARLAGGPFVMALQGDAAFEPAPRPAPPMMGLEERYQLALGPVALAYAGLTGLVTRSPARAFEALLLVNPRTALIGAEAAALGAAARVLRAGVIVVGTRPERTVRLPDTLLIDGPRVLTDGLEMVSVTPLNGGSEPADLLALASGIAAAAGSPWGSAFRSAGALPATEGRFDGDVATARVGSVSYHLGCLDEGDSVPLSLRLRNRGSHLLVLGRADEATPLALFVLRPRLAPGVAEVVAACQRHGVAIGVLARGDPSAAQAVARRAGVPLLADGDAVELIRARQYIGERVAFLTDSAQAAAGCAACDLAIGLTSGRSSRFPARADLLAPDLGAVAAIIEAGARRAAAGRDALVLSLVANGAGVVWGWRGGPGVARASLATYIAVLATLADGWVRLRGGERPASAALRLTDPHPERWGRRDVADVLSAMGSSAAGLSTGQATARQRHAPPPSRRNEFARATLEQLRAPLTGILAAGAGLSLVLGAPLDAAFIAAAIGVNVAVGAWQERRAGQATDALARLGAATARVLRDGDMRIVPAADVVAGDILLLAPGDRVAADARLITARGLEVDEAALTGESLPTPKGAEGGVDASRVVLEGSDVTVGAGQAVVVAVGRKTRMGATAAALAMDEAQESPLGARLSAMLSQILPVAVAGGALVTGVGVLRGAALLPQLALGVTIAIAAVPEGLPLLAGVGEAAVARRLAGRHALVRRLGAVEALGRVDVACTDKTGTLTEGRLAVRLVADLEHEAAPDNALAVGLGAILEAAALASPHAEGTDAAAHPTDVAVMRAATEAGLGDLLRAERTAEAPFDPARSFHAAVALGRLHVKGAAEVLAARCGGVRVGGQEQPLDEAGRARLRGRAEELASRGLRVLMVAEGAPSGAVEDPQNLVALGFVGISDPLRAGVRAAVTRCQEAGVRVVMLTGDHPATARAIAHEAGLPTGEGAVLTGAEIGELENGELDSALEGVSVIARVTPLDKLRIVESLQRHGHTVAMTGDGVNDAPALRLADVGVAMGRGGTEVARQAADVVLADDDFATLVEALVEGRSFWRNTRRALGLLLGGNLGELGLVVGASLLGLASPLTTRQILAVNLITDGLPALAVALQQPENRNLAGLAREGAASLEGPLRREILRRGVLTAGPALAAYLVMLGAGTLPQARTVAFASIVATQLAQTLDAGRTEGALSRPVVAAVAASAGLLVGALTLPPLRTALALATPPPLGWALIGAGAISAVGASHLLAWSARSAEQTRDRQETSAVLLPAAVLA